MQRRVFISYSSRDRSDALALRKLVEECGSQTWMDLFDISPTAKLDRELEQNVDSVDVLCLLLSPTAVASPWVGAEIARARAAESKGVKLLPILLRPTAIPDLLADLVAIDATRGLGDPAVAVRLRQFFAGDVPEGVRLDAFQRAELADQQTRNNAEAALGPLRHELDRVWDQPLRELTLDIDQDTWPDTHSSTLELVIQLDMFKGSAHLLVAPFVEGTTWRAGSGFDERAPDDVGPCRADARFSWAGRRLVLTAHQDGTDLGESPITFSLELDGSEIAAEERAAMQLVTKFELPSLRDLVDKGGRVDLWLHPREGDPVHVDPAITDLDLRLKARVAHDAIREVCLWRSRHERTERVILEAPSLQACATDLEREVVLSSYLSRALREAQNAPARRARITQLVDGENPIPAEDRWAAAHLLRTRADLSAFRGQIAPAAEQYRAALNLMLEDFAPDTARFKQFDDLQYCVGRLARLLLDQGNEQVLRHVLALTVDLPREMHRAHADDPAYQRALILALITRAEAEYRRFGNVASALLDEATTLVDDLARRAPTLAWRIAEAQAVRARADALRAPAPGSPGQVVYARWLDPRAASREVPILCLSALPKFSVKLSSRAYGATRQLHLVNEELIALYGDLSGPGWFSAGCREPDAERELPFERDAVLARAPFSLLGLAGWTVVAWDAAPTGDTATRWKVDQVSAARVLLRRADGTASWRAYLVVAEHRLLRWTIGIGFAVTDPGIDALVSDDAEAALAFRSLQLS